MLYNFTFLEQIEFYEFITRIAYQYYNTQQLDFDLVKEDIDLM